jgi:hypothetical protein
MPKTTTRPSGLSPLIRAVLKLVVGDFVPTFESTADPAIHRRSIAALRTAVADSCMDAFRRDSRAAGADPQAIFRSLVSEARALELDLQDLAPRVELAEYVELRLQREIFDATPDSTLPHGPGRSRSQTAIDLRLSIREMKAAKLTQIEMCQRLDANRKPGPEGARWDGLTWAKAYRSPKHRGKVKAWLSKAARVTA